jgi:hypothetical protein
MTAYCLKFQSDNSAFEQEIHVPVRLLQVEDEAGTALNFLLSQVGKKQNQKRERDLRHSSLMADLSPPLPPSAHRGWPRDAAPPAAPPCSMKHKIESHGREEHIVVSISVEERSF